jgi:long-chain acyl-CoA synthetase
MCAAEFQTPVERLQHWASQTPDATWLTQPIANEVLTYTWSEALREVSSVADFLQCYPPGSHIAILSLNCAHWIMADLAIQMAGHISIPIYPTASADTIRKILEHSESKAVFVGKMFEPDQVPELIPDGYDCLGIYQQYPMWPYWEQLVNDHQPLKEAVSRQADELMSITYTSGTTGDPKGVMVSYRAVFAAMQLVRSIVVIGREDRFVSYLPLAHVAERMAVECGSLYNGSQVSFIR